MASNDDGRYLKWIPDEKGGGHFTGLAADLGNLVIEVASKVTKNVSMIELPKLGTRINATTYDGCLGRLQANTSDFMANALDSKIFAPGIEIGPAVVSDTMGFFSAYDPEISAKKQELVHTLQNISPELWIWVLLLTLITSIAMAFGITVVTNITHKRASLKSASRYVYKCCSATFRLLFKLLLKKSGDDAFGMKRVFFKFMILLAILLAFYVNFYATAIIKTEAVTFQRPVTIENYDDIIEFDIRPIFPTQYRDYVPFKNAELGTKRHMIWEKAVKMGIEKSLVKQIDLNEMFAGRSVAFSEQRLYILPPILLMVLCKIYRDMDGSASHIPICRFDGSESEQLVFNVNSGHLNRHVSHALYRKRQSIIEAGFAQMDVKIADRGLGMKLEDEKCTDNRVIMPDAGFSPIRISQFRLLGFASIIALTFALLLFVVEKLVYLFIRKKKERRIHPVNTSIEDDAEDRNDRNNTNNHSVRITRRKST